MEQSNVIVEGEPGEKRTAVLTLRRGASTWGSWAFDDEDAGTAIRVGASNGCDWQIAAPGVTPLTVWFTGSGLLVRSERSALDVRLNGAPLWPGWVPFEDGDRLEMGPSCIEASVSESGDRPLREVHYPPEEWRSEPAPQPERERAREPEDETERLGGYVLAAPENGPKLWLYALFSVVFVLAYTGFVVMLDRY